ncbi:MAG: Sec-independent protein translocase subunit TatA [Candidatus Nanopelagicales bacterium]
MFKQIGAPEILIILLIVVLLFGAKRMPDAARGLGRSLRIFKAETKGLTEDDAAASTPAAPAAPAAPAVTTPTAVEAPAAPVTPAPAPAPAPAERTEG